MREPLIEIGTKLTLVFKEPHKDVETYYSKVVDTKENLILVDYPIHKTTKKTSFIPNNTALTASFLGKDQAVYEFQTEVVKRVKLNVPTIALRLPDSKNIKRIQRREFVRVDATADLAIHRKNDKGGFTTVTTDISGGGLSLIVPKGIQLKMNEVVDIWIVLMFKAGTYYYIQATSQVVSDKERNGVRTIGVKFLNLTPKEQQLIIRYCFEIQREMRKKELS